MIRLALFDIDGTLIRTGGAGVKAFAKTLATEFNLPDATRDLNFSGRTDPSLVRECFTKNGIPLTEENFTHFFNVYPFWLSQYLHELEGGPCPGVEEFIQDLKDLKPAPTLGLLTGNIRLGAEIKLRHYGLWEHFVVGAFADDDEDRNRLAGVAHTRGKQFHPELSADHIVVIGDTPLDVACGKCIGAKTLAVATGMYTAVELHKYTPTWTAETLNHFPVKTLFPKSASQPRRGKR